MCLKLFLIVSFICGNKIIALAQDADPIINTPLGKIRGTIKTSYKGKPFLSFEGIPYAKPPVGALRFSPPQPIEPWEGVWKAKRVFDCLQINILNKTAHFGEEDCLYINVYVPKEDPNLNVTYNVIVNIHGGSNYFGSGHRFGRPDYIMDRNLILVTFNYRLGAFGFLSTGDDNISGNNGLKDQTLALKWIQNNIASFSGRANSITLMGSSSGGSSVHFHYFSPLSRGLFHRGFSQSGISISPKMIDKNPVNKAKLLAEALGCPTNDTVLLTACVKKVPAISLIEEIKVLKKAANKYYPVVEKDAEGAFLTDLPLEMIKEKKHYDVPWIVSNTADEALTYANQNGKDMNYEVWNKYWNYLAANILNLVGNDTKQRTQEIKDFYFGKGQALTENNFNKFIQMLSEGVYVAYGEYSAKMQANFSQSPVYFYYFNFTGNISFTEYSSPVRSYPGASNGDDLVHIFPRVVPSAPSSTDLKMTEIFLDMLESYSQNSVPKIKNVEWRPIKDFSKLDYLQINSPTDIEMKTTEDLGNWKFWTRIDTLVALGQDADPIIKTQLGKIRGTIRKSYKGKPFRSFEGIPYAKPPVGVLRFSNPEPIEPWEGIWEAKTVYDCVQINLLVHHNNSIFGEEDCLYINVYVPEEKSKSNETYNVIVNIHGGSFYFGSGHTFGNPGYIMDRNVILVTLNYRLGPFGFLSTGDNSIPGNNGLKDQSLALKWIQSNIACFGGKSNSITLMGFSAGGASVHFHYFSPLSRDLFHRGLSQSGVGTGPWAIDQNPVKKANALAEALGCPTTNTVVLTKCLRQTPAKLLMDKFKILKKSSNSSLAMYIPVVEKNDKGAFLTDLPIKMIKEKKLYDVPWIVSNTADEGLTFVVGKRNNTNYDLLNTQWTDIIAGFVNIVDGDIKKRADEVKAFYFGKGQAVTEKNFNKYIQLLTEGLFVADSEWAAKLQANFTQSPVYYYYFNYSGSISFTEYITPERGFPGVSHGDDIVHIFPHIIPSLPSNTDLKMTEIFLDMLESNSQNSVPTIKNVEWRPIKNFNKLEYLHINSPVDIQMKTTEDLGNWKFWTRIDSSNN